MQSNARSVSRKDKHEVLHSQFCNALSKDPVVEGGRASFAHVVLFLSKESGWAVHDGKLCSPKAVATIKLRQPVRMWHTALLKRAACCKMLTHARHTDTHTRAHTHTHTHTHIHMLCTVFAGCAQVAHGAAP
eukprot:1157426-Pelagomonas_calceolata.AAC.12